MKFIILGAGPAGLSFANQIKEKTNWDFLVLEKEKTAGGLCRSAKVGVRDRFPVDIGGGHFLDTRSERVKEFLFKFMPENEWDRYERNSQIAINGTIINSPIESNIWQMELEAQVKFLKEIAVAGCNIGKSMPAGFIDWIYWKLGRKIATDYMLPYNQKMFGDDLNELGTYWLEKLPNVSFEETLISCLTHKAYGKQPAHAEFYYPRKHGYGEVWLRMAEALAGNIIYNKDIKGIDFDSKTVKTMDGECYTGDVIINTIPWLEFEKLIGMPEEMLEGIKQLKYTSVEIRYFEKNLNTDAQWIYYPDPQLAYHRILIRHNFCPGSNGYWTETRKERVPMFGNNDQGTFHYLNTYAYPLNTVNKPQIINSILNWCADRQVFGLGRWGEHQHYNSDIVVERALDFAERFADINQSGKVGNRRMED